jgi:hypothetical protein
MRLGLGFVVLSSFVIGVAGAPCCRAADPENPLKKATVGDWATFKTTAETRGTTIESRVKLTVSGKDDKEATLAVALINPERTLPGKDIKIDLTKPFDATSITPPITGEGFEVQVKQGDAGKETLTVGKTKYECRWVTFTLTNKNLIKKAEMVYEYKVWTSPDAPLGGLVKMERQAPDTKSIFMLEESGKAK